MVKLKSKFFFGLLISLSACLGDVPESPALQLEKEIAAIDAYLAANPPAEGELVVKDVTGVTLVISQFGTSLVPPDRANELTILYTGSLMSNGFVFEDIHSTPDNPFDFKLENLNVINGWRVALSMMTEGMIAKVFIPSLHAYGKSGKGSIPGNATLIFDINLMDVNLTSEQEAAFTSQKNILRGQLEGMPNLVETPEGIFMVTTLLGPGTITPGAYSQVEVKYSGRLFDGNKPFLQETISGPSSVFSSRSINYVHGVNLALQRMQEGGKATVYVPATLGYGNVAAPDVPANSNLIYDIELTRVITE